jgi:hypothetical protein
MAKTIKELPRKAVEKVIKVFATIHSSHYTKEDLEAINKALKDQNDSKK